MQIRLLGPVLASLLLAACGGSGPELSADVPNAGAPIPAENASAPLMAPATATWATGTVGAWTVSVTDLGLLPGGTMASARAINNTGKIVGIATDASFAIKRVIWDVNGTVLGEPPNYDPASTAEPASINDADFVTGTENISSTLREAVYWSKGVTGYTALSLTPLNQGSWVQTTARAISPVAAKWLKNQQVARSARPATSGGDGVDVTPFIEGLAEPRFVTDLDYRIFAANKADRDACSPREAVVGRRRYEVSHHYAHPRDEAGESCLRRSALSSHRTEQVLHIHRTPRRRARPGGTQPGAGRLGRDPLLRRTHAVAVRGAGAV